MVASLKSFLKPLRDLALSCKGQGKNPVAEAEWGDALWEMACSLRSTGKQESEILDHLRIENQSVTTPVSDAEVLNIALRASLFPSGDIPSAPAA